MHTVLEFFCDCSTASSTTHTSNIKKVLEDLGTNFKRNNN